VIFHGTNITCPIFSVCAFCNERRSLQERRWWVISMEGGGHNGFLPEMQKDICDLCWKTSGLLRTETTDTGYGI
jgi:hypothetical protein